MWLSVSGRSAGSMVSKLGWEARPPECSGPSQGSPVGGPQAQGSPVGGPRLRPAALATPGLCSPTRSWDPVSSSAGTSQSPAPPAPESPLAMPPSQRSRVGAGRPAPPV